MTNKEQQRLVGTVEILPNGKTIFTDQMLGLRYKLISCDANCETKKLLPFTKIGVKDDATKEQIYFEITGKYNPEKDEFVYSFIVVLNERKFVTAEEIKDLAFDKIQEKYTALEQETFYLINLIILDYEDFFHIILLKNNLNSPYQ